MDKIILTGDRPTGRLHVGHYVGSLRRRVELQNSGEYKKTFIMIADAQALTDNIENPEKVRQNIIEVALDYMSCGLDPSKATIFIQSQISELCELTFYYMDLVTVARLQRNPTVKSEIQMRNFEASIPVGFFTYPISQASDITAFKATTVPVGGDQLPMIEQTREIVHKFNTVYAPVLVEPKALLPENEACQRLPGIDGKAKMSKSLGNVVSPDDLVQNYGCDSLRMYELFVGPPEMDCDWDDSGIDGVFRFLNRVWKLVYNNKDLNVTASKDMEYLRNKLVYDITNRLEALTMNTVVSGFMEYTNKIIDLGKKEGGVDKQTLETLVVLLAPFAPHIAEELWKELGHAESVFDAGWPEVDESKLVQDTVEIALQVSGKFRDTMVVSVDADKDSVLAQAKEVLASRLEGKTIVKEIYVPGKIVNIIAK